TRHSNGHPPHWGQAPWLCWRIRIFSNAEQPRVGFFLELLQGHLQISHVLKTTTRVFPQATANDLLQITRKNSGDFTGGSRLLVQDCSQNRHLGIAVKRPLSGDHLVQDRTETENVRASIERFSCCLLWRHIGGCAQDCAFIRPRWY